MAPMGLEVDAKKFPKNATLASFCDCNRQEQRLGQFSRFSASLEESHEFRGAPARHLGKLTLEFLGPLWPFRGRGEHGKERAIKEAESEYL